MVIADSDISYTLLTLFTPLKYTLVMSRTRDKRFKKDYSRNDIIAYLQGVYKILSKSPTYRDLRKIPGPAASTIIRRFGTWSSALKRAGIRPQTQQLIKGERTFIRLNWRRMTDKEIAKTLGVTDEVIKYYRMNLNLWKNRKGTAKSTFRKRALKLYGDACESCGVKFCEWHHIVPKSIDPKDWCILCPTCHAVITRRFIRLEKRSDVNAKLAPFVKKLYLDLKI